MKIVILAGGKGTRLSEETNLIPKPMAVIGDMPIIYHIMQNFRYYGFKDFIILAGYKSFKIKEFFENFYRYNADIEINLKTNKKKILNRSIYNLNVKIIETGPDTLTGGRILKAKKYIGNDDFFLTYGDCISDINIKKLLNFHKKNKKIATVTAVNPRTQYGSIKIKKNLVYSFQEKPVLSDNLISGGFFVFKKNIFDLLKNESTILEREPLESLVKKAQLCAYTHKGFWHPMDNLRDKNNLNEMWNQNKAPWKKFFK